MKKHVYLVVLTAAFSGPTAGQVHIAGNLAIGTDGVFRVAGDVLAESDIDGAGIMLLKNDQNPQQINANGHRIQKLHVENSHHIALAGDIRVREKLNLIDGCVQLKAHSLLMESGATITMPGNKGHIVTDGDGYLIATDLSVGASFVFPIGLSTNSGDFTPVKVTNNHNAPNDIRVMVKDYAGANVGTPNAASGIDRAWNIYGTQEGAVDIALTHQYATEGSAFTRHQAFVTRLLNETGSRWSNAPGYSGEDNGATHTGSFVLTKFADERAWFSKSSDNTYSLGNEETIVRDYAPNQHLHISFGPNPASEWGTIRIQAPISSAIQYQLIDISGKMINEQKLFFVKGVSEHSVNLTTLPAGMYMLHFPDACQVLKFTKR